MRKAPSPGDVDELLPLNPVDFMVLLVLVDSDNYGYGIVKELRERSGGRIDLLPGNFYTVIQRMERDGLVGPSPEPPADNTPGKPRRLYRITELGRDVAAAEAARLDELVKGSAVRHLLERA